ncbi:M24 family metallopeptidase [Pedosphaera parvula]|nr:Xaa-Pro peptidase family protein [Pedosphaera parvula]
MAPSKAKTKNLLMVADSEHDANMLYTVGMFVPDPFIYLRLSGREFIVMSDLEIDRARKQAPRCQVLPLSDYYQNLRSKGKTPDFAGVIQLILRENKTSSVFVPNNFPFGLATQLKNLGISVKPELGNFIPEREIKTADEVRKLTAALRMAEIGMAAGIEALKTSKVGKGNRLLHQNSPLTSEKLRSIIDTAVLQAGGFAANTIVAGGRQGCDPHERGYGPLRANELIILDIFPRAQKTGYFGDITRTVVKGRATEAARKLYDTVYAGQKLAFTLMRANTPTATVHEAVLSLFNKQGYKTGKIDGRMQGFFHGTGHGLGLEIHESPRVGATSTGVLKAGQVITVEPGLYYSEIGGVRIEDVALITTGKSKNLTRFEKVLEV